MDNQELQRLLSYFSEKVDVCVEDHSTGNILPIENVRGEVSESGKFLIRLDINGGK